MEKGPKGFQGRREWKGFKQDWIKKDLTLVYLMKSAQQVDGCIDKQIGRQMTEYQEINNKSVSLFLFCI